MSKVSNITIAVKCVPEGSILDMAAEASLEAVELYTNDCWIHKVDQIAQTCNKYTFKYAIHAPTEGYEPDRLAALAEQIGAGVVVIHNIYWEDELKYLIHKFKSLSCKVCMENVLSTIEVNKYIRRYGLGRCLDLEHLTLETNGIFKGPLICFIKQSIHIHMTGYVFGSELWHTHIHHSPEHSSYLLNLLKDAGYSGFVVSEAMEQYQTYEEFKALKDFFENWKVTA